MCFSLKKKTFINLGKFFFGSHKLNKKYIKEKSVLGRNSTSLKIGIVGMPNVGKSTTFNLLSKLEVPAQNFPFCTIDPNLSSIPLFDSRFENLCKIFKPESEVPAVVNVIDIAGLVKGASDGEGLGNEFLSNISSVDGIFHLVRNFSDKEIIHMEGEFNPVRDMQIIYEELLKKDEQVAKKLYQSTLKKCKNGKNDSLKNQANTLEKVVELFKSNNWIRIKNDWTDSEIDILNQFLFLTAKPVLYLINSSVKDYLNSDKIDKKITEWINEHGGGSVLKYSAIHEQNNSRENEKSLKIKEIISNGYKLLDRIHYFTVGSDEVRCWTIRKGTRAAKAAGFIHTDFEKGFISAEVQSYDDFIDVFEKKGLEKAEKNIRKEGKMYQIKDGDIIQFNAKISR